MLSWKSGDEPAAPLSVSDPISDRILWILVEGCNIVQGKTHYTLGHIRREGYQFMGYCFAFIEFFLDKGPQRSRCQIVGVFLHRKTVRMCSYSDESHRPCKGKVCATHSWLVSTSPIPIKVHETAELNAHTEITHRRVLRIPVDRMSTGSLDQQLGRKYRNKMINETHRRGTAGNSRGLYCNQLWKDKFKHVFAIK